MREEVAGVTHAHDAHGHGHGSTTVVESDREGPAVALIVLLVLAALALLIWFFAFSGVVVDRDSGETGPTINNEQIENDSPTDTGPGTTTVPTSGGTGG